MTIYMHTKRTLIFTHVYQYTERPPVVRTHTHTHNQTPTYDIHAAPKGRATKDL